METDDWELLESWRAGQAAAGEQLVARYVGPVSRFFRSKLGDDVGDVVQKTFLACVENKDRVRGPSFRSYLFGVARLCLFERFRERARGLVLTDFGSRSVRDLGTSPTQRIAREQRDERTRQALAHLPVDDQIALQLFYWEQLSAVEIGGVLGLEPSSVRSRLSRARTSLKKIIDSMV